MNKQILKEFEENINLDDLIVMFSDFDCPWCYFSLGLMQEVKEKTGISVKRYPFQILPDVDTKGGLTVEAYDKMRGNTPQKRIENNKGIVSFAEQWDLPYVQRDRFFQSRPALTLSLYAQDNGFNGETFYRAIFKHQYGKKENIADPTILQSICNDNGFHINVEEVLQDPVHQQKFDDYIQLAHEAGISGVPNFIYLKSKLPGYATVENFLQFIDDAKERKKAGS